MATGATGGPRGGEGAVWAGFLVRDRTGWGESGVFSGIISIFPARVLAAALKVSKKEASSRRC
jgi:hypothetical protein